MRQEKQYLQDAIVEPLERHPAFVIMSYAAVPANTLNQFRREIASRGGRVRMARKRILMKAFEKAGIELSLEQLPGHIGIVFSGEDPIDGIKAVSQFCTEAGGKNVSILAGRIEGKVYNGQDITALSKLPGKDEMRAQLLATLEAPMAQTLAVMEALLSSVVYCLDNKCKQEEI